MLVVEIRFALDAAPASPTFGQMFGPFGSFEDAQVFGNAYDDGDLESPKVGFLVHCLNLPAHPLPR